ncbi:MAG: Hint domain-containing homing endonuclease [Roseomonas sp.]
MGDLVVSGNSRTITLLDNLPSITTPLGEGPIYGGLGWVDRSASSVFSQAWNSNAPIVQTFEIRSAGSTGSYIAPSTVAVDYFNPYVGERVRETFLIGGSTSPARIRIVTGSIDGMQSVGETQIAIFNEGASIPGSEFLTERFTSNPSLRLFLQRIGAAIDISNSTSQNSALQIVHIGSADATEATPGGSTPAPGSQGREIIPRAPNFNPAEGFSENWYPQEPPSPAPRCFLAGTPILMADGQEKPIEDIRVGDMVMSFDPSADQGRGALVPKPVSRTFQNITRSIIDLRGLYMTPGHVCLTDDGRFETIAEILLRDGILVEADGTPIRARTGAKVGSMEDTPVLIAYPDEKTGKEIFVRVRAGIPCRLIRERDGTKRFLSLALMLRAYHQTLTPDGLILSPDGSYGEATDWPEDSTPMEGDFRRNWVIETADGKPYVPEWIQAVAEEAREEQTVGATLQRIISPPSERFTPRVVDNPTPPARNRAERRAQKHRGPK